MSVVPQQQEDFRGVGGPGCFDSWITALTADIILIFLNKIFT